MQLEAFQGIIDIILLEALLAFMAVMSIGFYRFVRRSKFRVWAIGWMLFILLGTLGIFYRETTVSPIDLLAIGGMLVGALIIIDASRGVSNLKQYPLRYAAIGIGGALFSIVCFLYRIPASIGYMPPSFLLVYACFVTARDLRLIEVTPRQGVWASLFGLAVVAGSLSMLPLNLVVSLRGPILLTAASGVIITGAAMFTLMVHLLRQDLRTQIQISHLMTSVLQHDIRNYIQIAKSALEVSETQSEDSTHWYGVALEALTNAQIFVDDIRAISSTLSDQESNYVPIVVNEILAEVLQRVEKEYNLKESQIEMEIPSGITVYSNGLLRELLWNIVDNAFKHGSPTLTIRGIDNPAGPCIITVGDAAGGLPGHLKDFFNAHNSEDIARIPSNGLGMGLIRGLAPLCGARVSAFNRSKGGAIVGTVFHLEFDCARR